MDLQTTTAVLAYLDKHKPSPLTEVVATFERTGGTTVLVGHPGHMLAELSNFGYWQDADYTVSLQTPDADYSFDGCLQRHRNMSEHIAFGYANVLKDGKRWRVTWLSPDTTAY